MSISPSQYLKYINTKDLLESGLEHLKEKEEDENGDATDDQEKTGLPANLYGKLIGALASRMTGIPLDS